MTLRKVNKAVKRLVHLQLSSSLFGTYGIRGEGKCIRNKTIYANTERTKGSGAS